jgi:hypothetical protein
MNCLTTSRPVRAVHQVTGDVAVRFNTATAADLERWVRMLQAVAPGDGGRTAPSFAAGWNTGG